MYLKQSLLAGLIIGSFFLASTAEAKFLSVDPVQFDPNNPSPAMFNRYAYVGNDPINATDPFGLEKRDIKRVITGSRIAKKITVEAGNLTQSQTDSFASGLSNSFFEKHDGADFSGNSTDVDYFNNGKFGYKEGVYQNARDKVNIGYQIGKTLAPNSSQFAEPKGVFYHANPKAEAYGQNFTAGISITHRAVNKGITQVIATSIHERGHVANPYYSGGVSMGHQNVYNNTFNIMVGAGFAKGSFNHRCLVPKACAK